MALAQAAAAEEAAAAAEHTARAAAAEEAAAARMAEAQATTARAAAEEAATARVAAEEEAATEAAQAEAADEEVAMELLATATAIVTKTDAVGKAAHEAALAASNAAKTAKATEALALELATKKIEEAAIARAAADETARVEAEAAALSAAEEAALRTLIEQNDSKEAPIDAATTDAADDAQIRKSTIEVLQKVDTLQSSDKANSLPQGVKAVVNTLVNAVNAVPVSAAVSTAVAAAATAAGSQIGLSVGELLLVPQIILKELITGTITYSKPIMVAVFALGVLLSTAKSKPSSTLANSSRQEVVVRTDVVEASPAGIRKQTGEEWPKASVSKEIREYLGLPNNKEFTKWVKQGDEQFDKEEARRDLAADEEEARRDLAADEEEAHQARHDSLVAAWRLHDKTTVADEAARRLDHKATVADEPSCKTKLLDCARKLEILSKSLKEERIKGEKCEKLLNACTAAHKKAAIALQQQLLRTNKTKSTDAELQEQVHSLQRDLEKIKHELDATTKDYKSRLRKSIRILKFPLSMTAVCNGSAVICQPPAASQQQSSGAATNWQWQRLAYTQCESGWRGMSRSSASSGESY